jgi:hypothetical protein
LFGEGKPGILVSQLHNPLRKARECPACIRARALRLGLVDAEVLEADGDEDVAAEVAEWSSDSVVERRNANCRRSRNGAMSRAESQPDNIAESLAGNPPKSSPEHLAESLAENLPENPPENLAERLAENLPENLPES